MDQPWVNTDSLHSRLQSREVGGHFRSMDLCLPEFSLLFKAHPKSLVLRISPWLSHLDGSLLWINLPQDLTEPPKAAWEHTVCCSLPAPTHEAAPLPRMCCLETGPTCPSLVSSVLSLSSYSLQIHTGLGTQVLSVWPISQRMTLSSPFSFHSPILGTSSIWHCWYRE